MLTDFRNPCFSLFTGAVFSLGRRCPFFITLSMPAPDNKANSVPIPVDLVQQVFCLYCIAQLEGKFTKGY